MQVIFSWAFKAKNQRSLSLIAVLIMELLVTEITWDQDMDNLTLMVV